MASLMVGLIGPGVGPDVPLHGHKFVLRISGIGIDNVEFPIVVHLKDAERKETELRHCVQNGNYNMPETDYVSIEYVGNAPTLIAEIIRE